MNTDPANPLNKDAFDAFKKARVPPLSPSSRMEAWEQFLAGWVACREFYA